MTRRTNRSPWEYEVDDRIATDLATASHSDVEGARRDIQHTLWAFDNLHFGLSRRRRLWLWLTGWLP